MAYRIFTERQRGTLRERRGERLARSTRWHRVDDKEKAAVILPHIARASLGFRNMGRPG